MLGVYPQGNTGQRRHGHEFQGRQVAGVHHVGFEAAQQTVRLGVQGEGLPRWLVEADDVDVFAFDALDKLVVRIGDGHHGVPELTVGQVVDELDDDVLETAGGETVDEVNDVAGGSGHLGPDKAVRRF
ncbi:hypothetical protein D9M69_673480 [compost metagenome]